MTYRTDSTLWRTSLGIENLWNPKMHIDRLNTSLIAFEKNASLLAGEIARDLPDFTVHDVTHLSALWEMGSLIAGDQIQLNPVEAFVFGGSILLHDLGMAAAAYVEGTDNLKSGVEWQDTIELVYREYMKKIPTDEERASPPDHITKSAIEYRLRSLHAIHAEKLLETKWESKIGNTYQLLEDIELLDHFGEVIGRIAASHWWDIEKCGRELDIILSSPVSFPPDWTVDVLKIACLLRAADVAHIDNRRAPGFLWALRNPNEDAQLHWNFQNKLSRPIINNGLLTYNSTRAFTDREMGAWWLAFDNLNMIDSELRKIELMLNETNREPFQAKGVKGVEHPDRLSKHVRVSGWLPVNANVHVSNLPKLVKQLGGEALYGKNSIVPLRELIQNACDAVEARRRIEGRDENWGSVYIRVGEESNGDTWIEIEDNGIGMTEHVLTNKLLDFGTSYWGSSAMIDEHPGLLSKGYSSIGKFGIGFFSTFMLSDNVKITSRSIRKGPEETNSLIFGSGLANRPILIKNKPAQQFKDAGTKVRIYCDVDNLIDEMFEDFVFNKNEEFALSNLEKLHFVCRRVAPCVNTDLYVQKDKTEEKIVTANDWTQMTADKILLRLSGFSEANCPMDLLEHINTISSFFTDIRDNNGKLVGRACITPDNYKFDLGILVCGGLYVSRMHHICGVFIGEISNASRLVGVPTIDEANLKKWVSNQSRLHQDLMSSSTPDDIYVYKKIAQIICCLGGDTGDLPICETLTGYLSYNQVREMDWTDTVHLINSFRKSTCILEDDTLNPIFIDSSYYHILEDWPYKWSEHRDLSLRSLVIKAVSESWNQPFMEVIEYSGIDKGIDTGVWLRGSDVYGKAVDIHSEVLKKLIS
ncbi:ATP-binding protein [Paenibacillus sp. LS1]|uniref:HD domain-containing protein n=1 Tax=Paenibacillus sp. LS1 TaxID=2992120 RepID=UPI002231DC6B|nr:ATP-binding protein [Paenibacillus sp. LS1]MCW3795370.1 ATP-binding protein [Paenibacillus sp. LS1]